MIFHRLAAALVVCLLAGIALPAAAADGLTGYKPVDLTAWQPRTDDSVMALVEPLYRNHPESSEGRPSLKIELRKDETGLFVVDIVLRGYLDDSVEGEEYRGLVAWTEHGWRLEALGRRNICARGPNAGQATMEPCP